MVRIVGDRPKPRSYKRTTNKGVTAMAFGGTGVSALRAYHEALEEARLAEFYAGTYKPSDDLQEYWLANAAAAYAEADALAERAAAEQTHLEIENQMENNAAEQVSATYAN